MPGFFRGILAATHLPSILFHPLANCQPWGLFQCSSFLHSCRGADACSGRQADYWADDSVYIRTLASAETRSPTPPFTPWEVIEATAPCRLPPLLSHTRLPVPPHLTPPSRGLSGGDWGPLWGQIQCPLPHPEGRFLRTKRVPGPSPLSPGRPPQLARLPSWVIPSVFASSAKPFLFWLFISFSLFRVSLV